MTTEIELRLTANAAVIIEMATVAKEALEAKDFNRFAQFIGRVRGATADCYDDGLSLAPDQAAFQQAFEAGQQGD